MAGQENIPEATATVAGEDNEWLVIASGGENYISNCALTLSAVGIRYQVLPDGRSLLTSEDNSSQAIAEIMACEQENRNWPPPPEKAEKVTQTGNPPTLLMIGGLVVFYMITGAWFPENPWFAAGAVNSEKIVDSGQWWRLITALTLHADQSHLVGNCLIGGFMVHLLCKTAGYGTGWLSLLLAGVAGNWANIIFRETPHYSVGFSTAIFAAIGIFSGMQIAGNKATLLRKLVVPLGAGAGLLAMLGTEGKQTDMGAHLFGFACGIITGLLLKLLNLQQQTDNQKFQHLLFALSLLMIIGSWMLAIGR
jgi:membrane associated rhomboid family serine protease